MNHKLAAAVTAYITSIVAANVMAAELGQVGVGFGLLVSWGTFAAGFALVARDFVQRHAGTRWLAVTLSAIVAGGVLSWIITRTLVEGNAFVDPAKLALASSLAFIGAELVDLAVFTKTKTRLGLVAAIAVSNVVAAPVDTVLFLHLSGFGVTGNSVAGQLVGKLVWATAIPLVLYVIAKAATDRQAVAA